MSTRCQIGFYKKSEKRLDSFEALIYRHSDGYPGKADGSEYGVLADIIPFLNQYPRRDDTEYCSARLLQYLCNNYDKHSFEMNKELGRTQPKQLTGEIGHGISSSFHGDIEYLYAIYPDRVEVYDIGWSDTDKIDTRTLIETVTLNESGQA